MVLIKSMNYSGMYYLMKSILIVEKNGYLHTFHMFYASGLD